MTPQKEITAPAYILQYFQGATLLLAVEPDSSLIESIAKTLESLGFSNGYQNIRTECTQKCDEILFDQTVDAGLIKQESLRFNVKGLRKFFFCFRRDSKRPIF